MLPSLAVARFAVTTDPVPQITEPVPVRVDAYDPSWPPVLIVCVAVVVLGALIASVVFLRRARGATRPVRRSLDG